MKVQGLKNLLLRIRFVLERIFILFQGIKGGTAFEGE